MPGTVDAMSITRKTKMAKVAVVSYYTNINYGSALQAYALQTVIKNLDYHCEHIRYSPQKPNYTSKITSAIRNPHKILERLLPSLPTRRNRFHAFVGSYIDQSERVYRSLGELESTNRAYDTFVCGSDQIWAPNQFDPWYYLSFVTDKYRRIAYAPSIGLPRIPDHLKSQIADLVKGIEFLSIRERQGAQLIYELTGIHVPVVLDPTLLLTKEQWLAISRPPSISKPYALCYLLGSNPKHRDLIERYSQVTGYETVVLPFAEGDDSWGDVQLANIGPLEFIGLVNRANIVFTDSLHGMLFAINLNKPFNVFMRFAEDHVLCQNSRIENVIDMLGLRHRLVEDDTSAIPNDKDIDYRTVNRLLASERTRSLDYLADSLQRSTAYAERLIHA